MKMEFPLTYGLRKTGLPLILTSGKLKNVCFLIDTVSTHNSIFSFVYDHFKDEFQIQEEMQKTMGIEGNYQECQTVEATFNFEGTDYTSTFMIMDATSAMAQVQEETGIQIHGILGIQFLLEHKWIIDFEKRTVSCP